MAGAADLATTRHPRRAWAFLLGAALAALAVSVPARARLGEEAVPEADLQIVTGPRCVRDTMGRVHCARDPQGVALEDPLGAVRCAPGQCLRVEVGEQTEWSGRWTCSSRSGGAVAMTPEGPKCDGACVEPRTVSCELR